VVELMPETKTQRRPVAKKKPAIEKTTARKVSASKRRTPPGSARQHNSRSTAKRTTELSADVLKELEDAARSAIEAVRKFLGTVDEALPPHGEGPSRREEIADSALEMAQRLVHTQSEFLRKVVDSAGKSLSRSDDNAK